MSQKNISKLRNIISRRFDEGELRTLCFDIGIEYENLPGEGKADKARELLAYLERHNRVVEFVNVGKKLRPDISWDEISEDILKVLPTLSETQVDIRIGRDIEEFIDRLAKATHITIIGVTNRNLVEYLDHALTVKKTTQGPDAFWQSIRIVFPSENVLQAIDDELRTEFPDPDEANFRRIRIAGQAKRAISYFLIRANRPHRWGLYEYNCILPFVGAIFVMPNGKKLIEIATLRPKLSRSEYLFFMFSDKTAGAAYYELAFEEIIQHSTMQNEIVVIGKPQLSGKGFVCQHSRFRHSVLGPNPFTNDWIAAVIILLWCEQDGHVWPLLQVRTRENATRELDMLSNIAGYINQRDCREFDEGIKAEFLLQESAYENAVYRELREELGMRKLAIQKPELVDTICFYYPDKENFFFYLCRVKVEFPLYHIQPSALIRTWSFSEILSVRDYQVLSNLHYLLNTETFQGINLHLAAQVLADNLILHRHNNLARMLIDTVRNSFRFQQTLEEVNKLMKHHQVYYQFYNERRQILGLAGLQYREFFSSIVPAYAEIGVEGAQEYDRWLKTDENALNALNRLKQHYDNEENIRQVGLDL